MLCQSNSNKIILHILPVWFRFDIQPKLRLIWEQVSPLQPRAMFVTLQSQLQWTETYTDCLLNSLIFLTVPENYLRSELSDSRAGFYLWVWLAAKTDRSWQGGGASWDTQRYSDWHSQHWRTDWGHRQPQVSFISSPSHQHQHLQGYNSLSATNFV